MLSILFLLLAGVANAIMDVSSEDKFKNNFWNKTKSWKNKWKINKGGRRIKEDKKRWYYLWKFTPKYKERFPLSSSLLVLITDGWHLAQFFMLNLITLAVIFAPGYENILGLGIWDFILLRLAFGIGFAPLYNKLKQKSNSSKIV